MTDRLTRFGELLGKLAVLALGGALLEACTGTGKPTLVFSVNDERLALALERAARMWALNGLKVAERVKVNRGGPGLSVRFVPLAALNAECDNPHPRLNGCVVYRDAAYNARSMWFRDSLTDEELERITMHEIIHALIPGIPHLDGDGIFNSATNSNEITTADLDHICQYSECGEPPAGDDTLESWLTP